MREVEVMSLLHNGYSVGAVVRRPRPLSGRSDRCPTVQIGERFGSVTESDRVRPPLANDHVRLVHRLTPEVGGADVVDGDMFDEPRVAKADGTVTELAHELSRNGQDVEIDLHGRMNTRCENLFPHCTRVRWGNERSFFCTAM